MTRKHKYTDVISWVMQKLGHLSLRVQKMPLSYPQLCKNDEEVAKFFYH